MARFDVHPTPWADERKHTPYWLDVQADHLESLATRVIVPLRRVSPREPAKAALNPVFEVEGMQVYADTANIGCFPKVLLRRPVASLRHERLTIEDALDFLFTGL